MSPFRTVPSSDSALEALRRLCESAAQAETAAKWLNERYACRDAQIRALIGLLSPTSLDTPVLVVHGLSATGKTAITKDALNQLKTRHAIIQCRECITGRHLLEKTLAACVDCLASLPSAEVDRSRYVRCENLSALLAHLQRLFSGSDEKFVIVFDGVDQQREPPPTLEAGLARFAEYIPNLSIVFIATTTRSLTFHTTPPLYLQFPVYNQEQALEIVSRNPLTIAPVALESMEETSTTAFEDDHWLWTRFCTAVWESQAKFMARDIVAFRTIAEKLWDPFVQPIRDNLHGPRDFSKLMVANRKLFQSDDLLQNRIVPKALEEVEPIQAQYTDNMSYYSKFLLCAAYLASYNPARTDPIYFMKTTEKKRRRKGGGGKTAGRAAKHRKIPRRLLAPSPFPLERLLAIFRAILPHDIKPTIDIYTQLATLTSLRLLNRAGLSSDVLDPGVRWKVNASWDYVIKVGRGIGLELSEFAFEG